MIFNIPSSYYNLTSPDLVYWSQYDCGYHNRGEEIIIKKAGIPVAVIRQYVAQSSERVPGALAGKIKISPDFDELPPQIAKAFGMEV